MGWRILEVILNQSGSTIHIDAEHAIFGFPDENPNNPVNTMILFVKRFLYSCKFSDVIPNVNTLLRQVKEVCKIQLLKNTELETEFPGWNRLDCYLNSVWPASVHEELGTFGQKITLKPALLILNPAKNEAFPVGIFFLLLPL